MTLERKIRLIAGTFILTSLVLAWLVSPWWLLFTAFVGANLIQSALTGWCLMEDILRWTGVHRAPQAERTRRDPGRGPSGGRGDALKPTQPSDA